MRFAGFADGEPQSTGTTDGGSGFRAIGFKFSAVEFKFWSTNTTTTPPVLLFNGTGTDSDVSAVESVLNRLKLSYATPNWSQLNAMTETRLKAHKLFIVPGGNSITIGNNLSKATTARVRATVQNDGLHYFGFCA